jgi:CoA:oxalate CoA-transferase
VPCAPVLKLAESMAHPHLRQRKTVRRVKEPSFGEFDIPGMPVKFSAWPDRTELKASRLGGDNDSIMRELLGLKPDEIAKLYGEGVLLRAAQPASAAAGS